MPLNLGDVVTCSRCRTQAVAYVTGERSADVFVLAWHGYRLEATGTAPDLCLVCAEGGSPRPPPTRRVAIADDLARNGCRLIGAEWNTDDRLEDAYQAWIARGRPKLAIVTVTDGKGSAACALPCSPSSPSPPSSPSASSSASRSSKHSSKPTPAQGSLF